MDRTGSLTRKKDRRGSTGFKAAAAAAPRARNFWREREQSTSSSVSTGGAGSRSVSSYASSAGSNVAPRYSKTPLSLAEKVSAVAHSDYKGYSSTTTASNNSNSVAKVPIAAADTATSSWDRPLPTVTTTRFVPVDSGAPLTTADERPMPPIPSSSSTSKAEPSSTAAARPSPFSRQKRTPVSSNVPSPVPSNVPSPVLGRRAEEAAVEPEATSSGTRRRSSYLEVARGGPAAAGATADPGLQVGRENPEQVLSFRSDELADALDGSGPAAADVQLAEESAAVVGNAVTPQQRNIYMQVPADIQRPRAATDSPTVGPRAAAPAVPGKSGGNRALPSPKSLVGRSGAGRGRGKPPRSSTFGGSTPSSVAPASASKVGPSEHYAVLPLAPLPKASLSARPAAPLNKHPLPALKKTVSAPAAKPTPGPSSPSGTAEAVVDQILREEAEKAAAEARRAQELAAADQKRDQDQRTAEKLKTAQKLVLVKIRDALALLTECEDVIVGVESMDETRSAVTKRAMAAVVAVKKLCEGLRRDAQSKEQGGEQFVPLTLLDSVQQNPKLHQLIQLLLETVWTVREKLNSLRRTLTSSSIDIAQLKRYAPLIRDINAKLSK